MNLLKTILFYIACIAVAVFAFVFYFKNTQLVPIDLIVTQLPPQSFSLWVIGAFALGGLFGLLIFSAKMFRLKSEQKVQGIRLSRARQEVERLKSEDVAKTP